MAKSAPLITLLKKSKPLGIIISAIFGAVLFIYLFGSAVYDINGLAVQVALKPAVKGGTIIEIPPLGSISAATHNLPVSLQISLDNIGVDMASSLFDESENNALSNLKTDFPQLIKPFLIRQVLLAALGAAIFTFLLWRFRIRDIIGGTLVGALAVGLILGSLANSYETDAFAQPEVNGVLSLAANIFPEPDKLLDKLDEVKSQTRLMVSNIQTLYASVNGLASIGNSAEENPTRKILLVGDLHSNPVGIELISSITKAFKIDVIIDTGDLTDFGSPLEAKFAQQLSTIDLPYLFCPGNHDTPEIIESVNEVPNAQVFHGNIIEIADLKILGIPDPLSEVNAVKEEITQNQAKQESMVEQFKALAADQQPDIVVVHNPQAAILLSKSFPLIVTGHTHHQSIETKNSILINPGTTGAAGVRGLYAQEDTTYSAVILYMRPGEKAIAVDIIKYIPASHNFLIERKLLESDIR